MDNNPMASKGQGNAPTSAPQLRPAGTNQVIRGDVQYTQKKWIELVFHKCKLFLKKMGSDTKADQILQKPYAFITQSITKIYNVEGKGLMKWLTDEFPLDGSSHDNITSCKEKFKVMLSLDIWIDKLAQWQVSGYKLEMPKREGVDSLRWNKILSEKLKQTLKATIAARRPTEPQPSRPAMCPQEEMYIKDKEPPKRKYCNMPKQTNRTMEDPDACRQLKQKKYSESHLEIQNESLISTEKASDNSSIVRIQKQPIQKPSIDMGELFNSIEALKKKVCDKLEDESNKNVIHLSQLNSNCICVTQCISYIEEINSRAPKIIQNCLNNVQKHGKGTLRYTPIKPEIYTSKIPLKKPQ
ncbi:unnamed protein product [Moneuplotes crassus]|uniref:Uncharacterized protein n=1 Tax=Euplotes crassus TaxID=5936 RepID=A0AAD2DAS2_EUPCR|nr:unnamed protein product [Moneuplotes crassus]